jgi:hypothetical protein
LVDGLRSTGWDVLRVVDVFGERSVDETIFAFAAEQGRVLVSTDRDCLVIARRWLEAGRTFRLLFWQQRRDQRAPVAPFLKAFGALADNEQAFAGGVEYLIMGGRA